MISLNRLWEDSRYSSARNSVSMIELLRIHPLVGPDEIPLLIKDHNDPPCCSCGMISHGNLELYALSLYNQQREPEGLRPHSQEDCKRWIYDLFVTKSYGGFMREMMALNLLRQYLEPEFIVKLAPTDYENKFRIDLVVGHDSKVVAGIQVKPLSYKGVRKNVLDFNRKAHSRAAFPVFYLWYHNNSAGFENIRSVVKKIRNLEHPDVVVRNTQGGG